MPKAMCSARKATDACCPFRVMFRTSALSALLSLRFNQPSAPFPVTLPSDFSLPAPPRGAPSILCLNQPPGHLPCPALPVAALGSLPASLQLGHKAGV